jgi:hypothetical protein
MKWRTRALLALFLIAPAFVTEIGEAVAAETCPVPDSLALHGLSLPAVRRAVAGGSLNVLVLGGAAMQGMMVGDREATLPARLETALGAGLPGVRVRVVNAALPRATAESALPRMDKLIAESRIDLVIWATGAREAVLGLDVEPFVAAVQAGIVAVQKAGADLILLDMQYAPSITRIANLAPFRAALAGTAAAHDVPMLARYDLMMRWNDDGLLDLDATDSEMRRIVARKLFDCLAQALTGPIVAAVR